MNTRNKLFVLIAWFLILAGILNAEVFRPTGIGKNENYLTLHGNDFFVKSIYLLAWMPGENPALGEQPLLANYDEIMGTIKAAGANAVSVLHALMPPAFYEQARAHGLKIIQGVWFTQDPADFQDATFKAQVKIDIKNMIDNFHNRAGIDYSEDVLFLNIGNEFHEDNVKATNAAHPEILSYSGTYISASLGSNATECFLAEMCDYAVSYEIATYGVRHYVSHSTWSPVSPDFLNTSFLDIVSYNIYSYWPDWMLTHPGGSTTGTPYQGYIERMKSTNKTKPFFISEFGYSTAPSKPDAACRSEQEQADGLKQCWTDITTSGQKIAGATVFNYQDEWWTQANTASWPSLADEDEHAIDDREEWFGIIKIDGTSSTNYIQSKKPAYYAVQEMFAPTEDEAVAATTSGTAVRAYPNPCSRKKDSRVIFTGLQGKTRVEIYTLTGDLVFTNNLSGQTFQWNLLNSYDQKVANGVYIAKIFGDGEIDWVKVAVIP